MRHLLLLSVPLVLAACTTPAPPKKYPAPRSASSQTAKPAPTPAAPRWRMATVKADGEVVAGGRRHTVKSGETGIAIARAYGTSWTRITEANNLSHDSVIRVGQKLFIPTTTAGAKSPTRTQPVVDELVTGSTPAAPRPKATPKPKPQPAAKPPAPRPAQPASPSALAIVIPKLSWPTEGRVILSRFGPKGNGRVNDGVNIKAIQGQTVRAAADGEVVYVGDAIAGYGLMVLLRHGKVVTAYGHLEDALVDRGQKVTRGQAIGRAGSSGDATEPQVQFQVRAGRKAVDPLLHLPR